MPRPSRWESFEGTNQRAPLITAEFLLPLPDSRCLFSTSSVWLSSSLPAPLSLPSVPRLYSVLTFHFDFPEFLRKMSNVRWYWNSGKNSSSKLLFFFFHLSRWQLRSARFHSPRQFASTTHVDGVSSRKRRFCSTIERFVGLSGIAGSKRSRRKSENCAAQRQRNWPIRPRGCLRALHLAASRNRWNGTAHADYARQSCRKSACAIAPRDRALPRA